MMERIALFIDGANLHFSARALGFEIDFKRLLAEFSVRGQLVRAFFYTTISDSPDFVGLRSLIDWLDYNGFMVKTKPAKEYDDGEGRRRVKRSMGVELAIDAMEIADRMDHAYLFSGDGDFLRVTQALQRAGVRVTVVASARTKPPLVAAELRRQADSFLELGDFRRAIERHPTHELRIRARDL